MDRLSRKVLPLTLFILSVILMANVSVLLFVFPLIISVLTLLEVKINILNLISLNFILFGILVYTRGYYLIPAFLLLIIIFWNSRFDMNRILQSFIFCFFYLFLITKIEETHELVLLILFYAAPLMYALSKESNLLEKNTLLMVFFSFFLLLFSPQEYNLNLIGASSLLIFVIGVYQYGRDEIGYITTSLLMGCFFLSFRESPLLSLLFLIPYILVLRVDLPFESRKSIKSTICVLAFWILYWKYGISPPSLIYGAIGGIVFYLVPLYPSAPSLIFLLCDPIEYRFAEEVIILSLLLYGGYPFFQKFFQFDRNLLYYLSSFFLLIGILLAAESSLLYFLILITSYILLIKEKIGFDSEKIVKVAFSALGFWIILIRFNDLGYFGLFFSCSAGLLIYLLNDIIEE